MSGVELIAAALAAGASAGMTNTASAAFGDAYGALKGLLSRRLAGRQAATTLESDESDAGLWQARLGADLRDSGAADDEQVLAAARALLAQADLAGVRTFTIHVGTSNGAVGEFNAPVTLNVGSPLPPAPPAVP